MHLTTFTEGGSLKCPSKLSINDADPEEFLRQQQSIRAQMQGGVMKEEYSTYAEDVAELQARHKRVDVSFCGLKTYLLVSAISIAGFPLILIF